MGNNKKHILIITQYFYPEPFRINDISVELVKRGYKVTVLTGIPNYPQGVFYEGYKDKRHENYHGVDIIRLPIIARGHSSIKLIANYFSFVVSGWLWKVRTKIKADYVFTFEVSPMTQALIGVWYSKKNKIPNYLYVQDLWPENVKIVMGITNPIVIKPIEKMVKYIYKNCDIIFASSPSFVKDIQNRVENKNKVKNLPQYAEDFYVPMNNNSNIDELSENNKFRIVFTGNIGKAQGLDILPKVAQLISDDIEFVIVGDGRNKNEFEAEIKEKNVTEKFKLIPRQPPENIPSILSKCDVAFLSFMDNELFTKTIPAKLQSYMACGMPVLASAGGETERIINEAKCGISAPTGNVEKLASAINCIRKANLKEMSDNSIKYYNEHFSKKLIMDNLSSFFLNK